MYRTGDLVTLADDGNYYFHGRRDSMIKSRGYRIELGEIESALLSHPGVKEAAVLAIPDDVVGNRIKAVVATHIPGSLGSELQQHCASRSQVHDSGTYRFVGRVAQDFYRED